MKNQTFGFSAKSFFLLFVALLAAVIMTACGGSKSSASGTGSQDPGTPGIVLSASPSSLVINQGSNGTSTITITPTNGFSNQDVTLSVSGFTTGLSTDCDGRVVPVDSGAVTTVCKFPATSNADVKTAAVVVKGDANNNASASAGISVQVQAKGTINPSFSLGLNPGSIDVTQGSSKDSTLTATPSGGLTGPITLSTSGLTDGLTTNCSSGTVTITGTKAVTTPCTFSATSTATVGTAIVTVTGTSGSLTPQKATITVNVVAQGTGGQKYGGGMITLVPDQTLDPWASYMSTLDSNLESLMPTLLGADSNSAKIAVTYVNGGPTEFTYDGIIHLGTPPMPNTAGCDSEFNRKVAHEYGHAAEDGSLHDFGVGIEGIEEGKADWGAVKASVSMFNKGMCNTLNNDLAFDVATADQLALQNPAVVNAWTTNASLGSNFELFPTIMGVFAFEALADQQGGNIVSYSAAYFDKVSSVDRNLTTSEFIALFNSFGSFDGQALGDGINKKMPGVFANMSAPSGLQAAVWMTTAQEPSTILVLAENNGSVVTNGTAKVDIYNNQRKVVRTATSVPLNSYYSINAQNDIPFNEGGTLVITVTDSTGNTSPQVVVPFGNFAFAFTGTWGTSTQATYKGNVYAVLIDADNYATSGTITPGGSFDQIDISSGGTADGVGLFKSSSFNGGTLNNQSISAPTCCNLARVVFLKK